MRFFAAMWVVAYHYWPKLAGEGLPDVVAKGYLGVELFFVLSGYILCHVYLTALDEGRFDYRSFVANRLARIYPTHIFAMFGVICLALAAKFAGASVDPNLLDWASLPANLTLTQAWGFAPQSAFNHASWSVSAEWFAYLAFPLFGALTLSQAKHPVRFVLASLIFMMAAYALYQALTGHSLTEATIRFGHLRIVPCFLWGCAIYNLDRSLKRDSGWITICGFAVALVMMSFVTFGLLPDVAAVTGFGALILALSRCDRRGTSMMSNPVLVYLGEASYALYMICIPWMLVFVNGANRLLGFGEEDLPLMAWLALLIGVIPLSVLVHEAVEKPARLAMRVLSRTSPARAQGAHAP
jgi:peptidoglycan/LPS O-acetylase OafA/YrhL